MPHSICTSISEINLIAMPHSMMQKCVCLNLSLEQSLTETNLLKQVAPSESSCLQEDCLRFVALSHRCDEIIERVETMVV